jgi:hypothetical protein
VIPMGTVRRVPVFPGQAAQTMCFSPCPHSPISGPGSRSAQSWLDAAGETLVPAECRWGVSHLDMITEELVARHGATPLTSVDEYTTGIRSVITFVSIGEPTKWTFVRR